nr:hypothetical protein [uncultured Marvinbryantia sp.]
MMEYLTQEHWERINSNEQNNKGINFEQLVYDLLIAEYGKMTFQSTRHSWDGNRDFFYYSAQKNFWAECKNYASNIDLKVLAATLVMAQISEIDTILFFSYSPINVNTKAKLLINAAKKGKTIYFYDDIVLERKIFQHWSHIGEKYFPHFLYDKIDFAESTDGFEAKCLLFGNPLDASSSIDGYELKNLTLFKMFEMDICIINKRNAYNTVSLSFKQTQKIRTQFEIYPEYMVRLSNPITLSPYEGKNIRLHFIPIKENCVIPTPYINKKPVNLPKNVEFKSLEPGFGNNKRLIGQSYEQCLGDFKKNVLLETDKLKTGIFYGNSGTGKTKLYEECLNVAKINGYEIIEFGNMLNAEKTLFASDFIQKLLIAIYNISLDALEQILKATTFCDESNDFLLKQPEYRMLADIFIKNNTNDLKVWLDQYLNLIVTKLAKNKYLIAIDNVQFLNDSILDLIDSIFHQLTRIRPCYTKFLLTFNVDYIKRNSRADQLLGTYTANRIISFSKHIIGFEDSKECYEFLQEVFSIGDVFHKTEVNVIAENLNKNPFYLEQMIYWLRDRKALEQEKNCLKVKNVFLTKSLIRNIPTTVYDILMKRWYHYKEQNTTDFEHTVILFSALHLYKELEKKDIDKLNISWNTVTELARKGFLLLEDNFMTITVKFRHDLVDKFFSRMYCSFSKKIIDYENEKGFLLRNNDFRYYIGILYTETPNFYLSNDHLSHILNLHIDGRLAYEFYVLVFEKYFASFEHNYKEDPIICINNIHQIIICIHDNLGNAVMKKYAEMLLFELERTPGIHDYAEYGKLLLYISEAYDSMGDYSEAVQLIKDYKNKAFGKRDENAHTLEQKKLLSEIYNRLHVYSRHPMTNPLEHKEIMRYLDLSAKIADDISFPVMQYVNYSDRGYLYYDLPCSDQESTKTRYYWERACETYEKGGAEIKELNYFRKKVQLTLLKGEAEEAIKMATIGLDQIDLSSYAYQQTFFKWWFYHALAEAFLMEYKYEYAFKIEHALERAQFYSQLLDSNKKFYYLQLRAVYMYYTGEREKAIAATNEALTLAQTSNYKMKKDSLIQQLKENLSVMHSDTPQAKDTLYSQIYTADGLFNLPCM